MAGDGLWRGAGEPAEFPTGVKEVVAIFGHCTPRVTHLEALEAPHERSCQTVPEAHVAELSRERLQQGLGLLEVGGVKALGEPAVDRCE